MLKVEQVDGKHSNLILIPAFGEASTVEVRSVLKEKIKEIRKICDSAYILRADSSVWDEIRKLAGFHKVGVVTFEGSGPEALDETVRLFEESSKKNYSVSLYCSSSPHLMYTPLIEDLLLTLRSRNVRRVNLVRTGPRHETYAEDIVSRRIFDIIVVGDKAKSIFGVTTHVFDTEGFRTRSVSRPSEIPKIAMSPRLARTLVNITSCPPGGLLMDPFCGSGTILGEAMLMGIDCIGIDIDRKQIRESHRYLEWLRTKYPHVKLGRYRLVVGDARSLGSLIPDLSVDAVVTEPILLPAYDHLPAYSDASRALQRSKGTYQDALHSIGRVLKIGGLAGIVAPEVQTKEGPLRLELESSRNDRLAPILADSGRNYIQLGTQSTRWVKRNLYLLKKV